ncbi:MAG: hypothetical protein V3S31_04355 [Dehalococcoidia bacterium]
MATLEMIQRPAAAADYSRPSRYRTIGFLLGFFGLALAVVTLIANIVAAGDIGEDADSVRETLAWSFGLTITAFAMLKFGIATVLMGVLIRAWMRVESVKVALPQLKTDGPAAPTGDYDSPSGPATATETAPPALLIHRIAPKAWAPMVVMGVMLVAAGLAVSLIQVGEDDLSVGGTFSDLGAWVQGLQFLGEAMLLAGISFLLGSILGTLRGGGGEVQESMGLTVKTLKMPPSAKLFMAIMMMGMMVAMAQFVLYIVAAGQDDPTAWYAWLGAFRELGLALLLLGIVMALYTIGTVLNFQFHRMREIVTEGS